MDKKESPVPLKDEVFKDEITKAFDFKFGEKVASVFDDMVNRSVPFYEEIQRMIGEIAADHTQKGGDIYDLGCSTGTTMVYMNSQVDPSVRFIGIDDSPEMLAKCETKLKKVGFTRPFELRVADLGSNVEINDASVVILCLTLQFVRPIHRERLLKKIVNGLKPGGVLILVEKNPGGRKQLQPRLHQILLQYEAQACLQRNGNLSKKRSPRKRVDPLQAFRKYPDA